MRAGIRPHPRPHVRLRVRARARVSASGGCAVAAAVPPQGAATGRPSEGLCWRIPALPDAEVSSSRLVNLIADHRSRRLACSPRRIAIGDGSKKKTTTGLAGSRPDATQSCRGRAATRCAFRSGSPGRREMSCSDRVASGVISASGHVEPRDVNVRCRPVLATLACVKPWVRSHQSAGGGCSRAPPARFALGISAGSLVYVDLTCFFFCFLFIDCSSS